MEWVPSRGQDWVLRSEVRCGFKLGMEVQDVPRSRTRPSLGEGVVRETREIGGREQVLVEFPDSGQRFWIPYENLRQIKGPYHRFALGQLGGAGNAERFRLRSLARAIEVWNENTGALSRLDIDPLPHQIHSVHHILASGNLNWLIADDVGLGKTIEVGMLLAALKQRGAFRRILIVTPAGLVKQWQEELFHKFNMKEFLIYGRDFEVHETRQWKLFDHVIGSIDRLKQDQDRAKLMQAGAWDLVIFDEAHRLSRRQYGLKLDATERFRLAAMLRDRTDSMILLTGTPHQGMQDKFQALLELLRPEWKSQIRALSMNPEILRDLIIRNNKSTVTDAEANFIFKGKKTYIIEVPTSPEAQAFDRRLQDYLRKGYRAGKALGRAGIAIGFVMTTYRKLAASSVAAIHLALVRRRERLLKSRDELFNAASERVDERFFGEWEEHFETQDREFFDGELALLGELIEAAAALADTDLKLSRFMENLVERILQSNPREKVLIFTEYRATQDYLAGALRKRFGDGSVVLINGSMDFEERGASIADFEDTAQFLISTEAGGEGINLHRRCHLMVNFDLPWNPMRLTQRVGRLYRYGQKQPVVVFNVESLQTLDSEIVNLMYRRIEQVVADLSVLGSEFHERLADEIVGELTELLDVEEILERLTESGVERTEEEIEAALERAREALAHQRELMEFVTGYDPEETRGELRITNEHVASFLEAMFAHEGVEIVDRTHGGRVWDIRIPDAVKDHLHENRWRFRVTLDRDLASRRDDIHMLDLEFPLFRYLLEKARAHDFDGLAASIARLPGRALFTALLRWQNDQGVRLRQEFAAVTVHQDGRSEKNPEAVSEWLLEPANDGPPVRPDIETAKTLRASAEKALDKRLGEVSNLDLHPESRQWISAGWCEHQRRWD